MKLGVGLIVTFNLKGENFTLNIHTLYSGQIIKGKLVRVHSAARLSIKKRPVIVRVKTKVKMKIVTAHFLEHSHLVLPETNGISYQKKHVTW